MVQNDTRSSLSRAIGLGSARSGVSHWWAERISAIALIPLTLWFLAAVVARTRSDYTTFVAWMHKPATDVLMTLLLITLFYHTQLGVQVIVEDYVHSGTKFAIVILVRFVCFAFAVIGILSVLRIATGL